ncbi:MAG: small basic protein [Candidatus Omnitrophota bacterium]
MSIHPSLALSLKGRKQRSVLKRVERMKYFMDRGSFNQESSVFGLPKIKVLKIKVVKKEKAEGAAAPAAAGTASAKTAKTAKTASPAAKTTK